MELLLRKYRQKNNQPGKNNQSGLTLIETSLTLLIITTVMMGIFMFMQGTNRDLELRNDAKKINLLAEAAQNFMIQQRNAAAENSNTDTLQPGVKDDALPVTEIPADQWQFYLPPNTDMQLGQREGERYSVHLFNRDFRTVPSSPTNLNDPQAMLVLRSTGISYTALDGEKLSVLSDALVKYINPEDTSSTITGPNESWTINKPASWKVNSGDLIVPIFLPPLLEKIAGNPGLEIFRGKEWQQLADPTYLVPRKECAFYIIVCVFWKTLYDPVLFPPSSYSPSYPDSASRLSALTGLPNSTYQGVDGSYASSVWINAANESVRDKTINLGRDRGFHTSALIAGFDPQNGLDRGSLLREAGKTYINDTGLPLMISVTANLDDSMTMAHCSNTFDCLWLQGLYLVGERHQAIFSVQVEGITVATEAIIDSPGSMVVPIEVIIPPGNKYRVSVERGKLISWAELR